MTTSDHTYWESVARRARWSQRRETTLILLVVVPLILLLNVAWLLLSVGTGHWWILF